MTAVSHLEGRVDGRKLPKDGGALHEVLGGSGHMLRPKWEPADCPYIYTYTYIYIHLSLSLAVTELHSFPLDYYGPILSMANHCVLIPFLSKQKRIWQAPTFGGEFRPTFQ